MLTDRSTAVELASTILTEEKKRYWHQIMSDDDFDRVFGPRTQFNPGGEELAQALFFHTATYGGLINKPGHALDYAKAVAKDANQRPDLAQALLRAKLGGDCWSIEDTRRRKTVMTIMRKDRLTRFIP